MPPEIGRMQHFVADLLAQQGGREIDVYTVGVITCCRTRREAEEYYRHWAIDSADWTAVDRIMAMRGVTRDKFPDDFEERRHHHVERVHLDEGL